MMRISGSVRTGQGIDAAVAADGAIVSTDEAPTFTVLADPQGNKICRCKHIGCSH